MTQKILILIGIIFQLGCSTIAHARPLSEMTAMAHRGVYQTYPRANLKSDTGTAEMIYPPAHDLLMIIKSRSVGTMNDFSSRAREIWGSLGPVTAKTWKHSLVRYTLFE